jgi:hypothetical protein
MGNNEAMYVVYIAAWHLRMKTTQEESAQS